MECLSGRREGENRCLVWGHIAGKELPCVATPTRGRLLVWHAMERCKVPRGTERVGVVGRISEALTLTHADPNLLP